MFTSTMTPAPDDWMSTSAMTIQRLTTECPHQQWLPSIWDYILISNDYPASETTFSSALTNSIWDYILTSDDYPAPETTFSSAMNTEHLRLHSISNDCPASETTFSSALTNSTWDYILISKDYPAPRRFCIGFRDKIVMDWHSSQYPLDPGVVFHYRVLRGTYNILYILFLEFWQHAMVCLGLPFGSTR